MLDAALVTAIVGAACLHAAWQLLPTVWRLPAAARIASRIALRGQASSRRSRWLLRVLRAPSAGCGDCGGRARCPAQGMPAATANDRLAR